MAGIHRYLGTVEVGRAKTDKEAPNLGQVKELINRYCKEPVRVATTGELGGTFLDGVLTVPVDLNTIDGVTMQLNDAVLVKDEINKVNNGIYVITNLGTPSTPSKATASFTSTTITSASVNKETFEGMTSPSGDKVYTFIYDGTTDMTWKLDGVGVTLADYGVSFEGSESDLNEIAVDYKAVIPGTSGELTLRDDWKVDTIILNNTFVSTMEGTQNGDCKYTIVNNGVLRVGQSDFTFIKDIDTSESSIQVAKANVTPDGSSKVFNIAHNFNLSDEYGYVLKVMDNSHNEVYVDNVPKLGDEKNAITLTFDNIPEISESFTVYVLGLE